MSFDLEQATVLLQNEFPQDILDIKEYRNETTLLIKKDQIHRFCKHLKDNLDFTFLADLTAVDYLEVKLPRYEVVYHIHRFGPDCEENIRIRLKAELTDDNPKIDSVASIWSSADWLEREVYDMFGIEFTGHPDLRRILMPEDYGPFPLRKDFDVRNREASKESFEKALEDGRD
ncbi:MAG: NADH-quinone oxidoreductase subunit C [Thermodesulfobacteriota bacterium]|nr:MAG: NADH-quinone oxidoreductase subunit C [Thermodesulfobacteriota bacterium]